MFWRPVRRVAAVTATALLILLGVVGVAASSQRQPHLVVSNQKTGEVYLDIAADDVSSLELSWIHSIEKTPWRERYVIRDDEFELTDVYLKSYGAGAPTDIGGNTSVENGVIHISELQTGYEEISWVHSHDTHHKLIVYPTGTAEPHVIAEDLPQRTFLRARVTKL